MLNYNIKIYHKDILITKTTYTYILKTLLLLIMKEYNCI